MDQKWNKNKTMAKRIVEQFLNNHFSTKIDYKITAQKLHGHLGVQKDILLQNKKQHQKGE